MNEAAFELPGIPFRDRTVNVLETKTADDKEIGVLVARAPFPEKKGLVEAVQEHQEQERRSLAGWSSSLPRHTTIDGRDAIDLTVRYKGDRGMIYQHQLHVDIGNEVLALVVHGPLEEREACDEIAALAATTLRLRETT